MLAKRKSRRSRVLFRRLVFLSLVVLLAGSSAYLVYFSGLFNIEHVEVDGGDLMPGFDGDQYKGKNILFLDVEINLDEYPKVATYKVNKDYFKKTLRIDIGGRERFTIWCTGEEADKCFWVDDTGVAFSHAPNLKGPLVFRLVRDFSNREIGIRDNVLEEDFFNNLKLAFEFLDEAGVAANELRLDNLKFREMTAYTSEGPKILFSLEQDPAFGLSVVQSLKSSGEWELLSYLDLRIRDRAYYSQ